MTQNPTLPASDPAPRADDPHSDNAKRRQILDGARTVFLEHGFDAASMNDITRAAGVSKATIYAYFPSKEALFAALITCDKQEQGERLLRLDDISSDPRQVLAEFGQRLLQAIAQSEGVARARMVIAITPRQPQIGQAFYEAGYQVGVQRIGAYLGRQVALGRIDIPDPTIAAEQFIDLCVSGTIRRFMFGVQSELNPAEIQTIIARAIEMFFRAYPQIEAYTNLR